MIFRNSILWLPVLGILFASPIAAADPLKYCNTVQNRNGFIRYPLGTVGIWSTASGELADVMTRVPRIYPCVKSVTVKSPVEDWRSSITGDPSVLTVKYRADKPSGATTVRMTVSPHVSVFAVKFPEGSERKYLAFDFSRTNVESWWGLNRWTERRIRWLDSSTFQASIGVPGGKHAYYVVRFSVPCAAFGAIDTWGHVSEGTTNINGVHLGVYARFDIPAITVAVAESFTGLDTAKKFLATEFTGFAEIHSRCHEAWDKILSRIEVSGTENSKRLSYTALYTILANIINADDGSCYAAYCAHPMAVSSSTYWQFVGGYQSCAFDNSHATYPFLMLAYPEIMSRVLDTYLARYKRDGFVSGDACLYTGWQGSKFNLRYSPIVAATAWSSGISGNYSALYEALKQNFDNTNCVPASLYERGYLLPDGDNGFACSRTLEYSTAAFSLALLAAANHDSEREPVYLRLSKSYTNLWDARNKIFRLKMADGHWGPMSETNWTWNPNPWGLFEGTSKDWSFDVPHDPFGLLALPGQQDFICRVRDYCLNYCWFNDYQYLDPYLLYYAGAADTAQKLIRHAWVPLFQEGVMYEGVKARAPHEGWNDHYTSNAGWLLCSMLGLYPIPAPPGQFIISSPSIAGAVIHSGTGNITITTTGNSDKNIYVRSIRLDGKVYPCYMISAQRLKKGATLALEMGTDPAAGLGSIYVAATDGFVLDAERISPSHLKCIIQSPLGKSTTRIYSQTRPEKILLNGWPDNNWSYNEANRSVLLQTTGTTTIEVFQ